MEGMLNYFVPEDGDSSDHLNVVPLPRVEQLRLQHVKKVRLMSFPLPGDFHFRFKTAFEGTYAKREEPQAAQKTFNNDLVGLVGEAIRVLTKVLN
ncbi:hypothetical protein AM588_10005975 [Phytophthora nicotianae]|uniref:Uncharacterized protein n=1 Tax=Phytophthora nicotianae TaxID=4792 RepID=A0A0W8DIF8_PHYNI|nr:hypothetical protein AM588_10005975 [Phytophthora nicotianae]